MDTQVHNKLFTPVQIGAITLKHRSRDAAVEPASSRVAEWRAERFECSNTIASVPLTAG